MNIKCWICRENFADSEEHKFKSSDIRSAYGKKIGKVELALFKDNKEIILQSYKDKNLKFPKSICSVCNNSNTQNADIAYSKLTSQICNNFYDIKQEGNIDYNKIYEDWELGRDNFYRYIAKQAGCRINAFNKELLPKNLAKFILGEENNLSLKLFFVQKEGIEMLKLIYHTEKLPFLHLANGSTVLFKSDDLECFHGWLSYNWLTIHWFCGDLGLHFTNINKGSIEQVKYQPLLLDGKDKSINMIDWIESYGINSENDRKKFIKSCF